MVILIVDKLQFTKFMDLPDFAEAGSECCINHSSKAYFSYTGLYNDNNTYIEITLRYFELNDWIDGIFW